MVSPTNSTSSDSPFVKVFYKRFLRLIRFFTEYYELKLSGFCLHGIYFKLIQSLLASCSRFPNTVSKFAPQEYKVLSTAKLQISDFSMTRNKPFINIMNNRGASMESC